MSKNNKVIEINGKKYDAQSGASLAHSIPVKVTSNSKISARQPAQHAQRHAPKHSQTLMRQSVKKPAAGLKRQLKVAGHTDELAKQGLASIEVKRSITTPDHERLQKAKKVSRSQHINHFSSTTSDSVQPDQPQFIKVGKASAPAPTPETEPEPAKPKTTTQILEQAIEHATSHQQPAPHAKRPRTKRRMGIAAASMLSIMLLGAIGYHEWPTMRLNLASAKAGLQGDLPAYRPPGYDLTKLTYGEGAMASHFKNAAEQGSYTIIHRRTTWDSRDLRDNYVDATYNDYEIVENNGRTIYIFGDKNATWVNQGIWYQIRSNGALSTYQLVEIATSI